MEMIKRDKQTQNNQRKQPHKKISTQNNSVMITARELCFLGPYCGRSVMNEFARESIEEGCDGGVQCVCELSQIHFFLHSPASTKKRAINGACHRGLVLSATHRDWTFMGFSNSVKTAARLKKMQTPVRSTRIFQLIHTAVNHVFPVAGCILIGFFLAHSKLKIHDGRTRMWTGDE